MGHGSVTYLAMASVMLVGIVTTLCIREARSRSGTTRIINDVDYYPSSLRSFLYVLRVFVLSYIYSGKFTETAKTAMATQRCSFYCFRLRLRFIGSGARLYYGGHKFSQNGRSQ